MSTSEAEGAEMQAQAAQSTPEETASPAEGLHRYRSHKIVSAGRIAGIAEDRTSVYLESADGPLRQIKTPPVMYSRFVPSYGDYLVVYGDGYISFSPKAAFEDGYSRVTE